MKPVFFFARDVKLKSTEKFGALALLVGLTFKHVKQVTAIHPSKGHPRY